jgi:hypothetical protein
MTIFSTSARAEVDVRLLKATKPTLPDGVAPQVLVENPFPYPTFVTLYAEGNLEPERPKRLVRAQSSATFFLVALKDPPLSDTIAARLTVKGSQCAGPSLGKLQTITFP